MRTRVVFGVCTHECHVVMHAWMYEVMCVGIVQPPLHVQFIFQHVQHGEFVCGGSPECFFFSVPSFRLHLFSFIHSFRTYPSFRMCSVGFNLNHSLFMRARSLRCRYCIETMVMALFTCESSPYIHRYKSKSFQQTMAAAAG